MNQKIRLDVLFLTALLTLRVLIVPAIFVDYQLRKDYIARYLCVNRDRPDLHCDGKCYLAKRLQAAQQQEQQQKGQELGRYLFELPFDSQQARLLFVPEFSPLQTVLPVYQPPIPASGAYSFFHPPQLV